MDIKNIVFDFRGVLVDWNSRYLYKDHFKDTNEMEFFLKNICTDKWEVMLKSEIPETVSILYDLKKSVTSLV